MHLLVRINGFRLIATNTLMKINYICILVMTGCGKVNKGVTSGRC